MTKTTTLEEKLENKIEGELTKFAFGHISLRVCRENILIIFQETIEQAMPEKWVNVMGIGYKLGYNAALEEYRENLLKAIGKAGE